MRHSALVCSCFVSTYLNDYIDNVDSLLVFTIHLCSLSLLYGTLSHKSNGISNSTVLCHDSFALHVSHFLPLGRTMPLTPTSTFSTFCDGYRSCKKCTVTSTTTILSAKKRSFVKSWKNQNILDRQLKNSKLDSGEWAYRDRLKSMHQVVWNLQASWGRSEKQQQQ